MQAVQDLTSRKALFPAGKMLKYASFYMHPPFDVKLESGPIDRLHLPPPPAIQHDSYCRTKVRQIDLCVGADLGTNGGTWGKFSSPDSEQMEPAKPSRLKGRTL